MAVRLSRARGSRGPSSLAGAWPWIAMYLVAAGLRALYAYVAIGPHAAPYSDPAVYDQVAWNLALGGGFSQGAGERLWPTAFVPPVLPWLTSLVYRAFGHDYFAAVLAVAAIGGLVPLLLAAFASRTFGGGTARVAGWLAAVHPMLVFFSGYLLTETPFTVLLLLALLLSAEWVKTPRRGRALGTGIAWGLASLTRPTALPLPALVAAWAWIPLGLTLPGRERLRQVGLLLLGLALAVGPWTVRNAVVLHAFVPITTGAGNAMFQGNNAAAWDDPRLRGGAVGTTWDSLARTEYRGLPEPEVDARARARTMAFLRARAREIPSVALAKLARFWRLRTEGGGTGAWQRPGSPLGSALRAVDPLLAWSVVALPLALWGVVLSLRGPRRWFQSLSLWVIAWFTAVALVFFGSLRMRVPVEPLVTLFAAVGLADLWRRLRLRRTRLTVVPRR